MSRCDDDHEDGKNSGYLLKILHLSQGPVLYFSISEEKGGKEQMLLTWQRLASKMLLFSADHIGQFS